MAIPNTHFLLQSDACELPDLQARLLTLAQEAGLDDLSAFQLTCATIEAINNCIEHAYDGEAGHPISLLWERDRDEVAIEIRDRGRPMTAPPPAGQGMPRAEAESGRGWGIIREWTDSATHRREAESNVLRLTRRLR